MTTHIICSHCGSTDVYADATARWDAQKDEWIMSCVHDDRYCDQCGGEANLIEVDEDLEIGFYGMVKDGDGARLVQDHETPDYFDVMVRTTALESGEILSLYEFDNLTRKEANQCVGYMTLRFPTAPIDLHLGEQPQYTPRGKYLAVTREQYKSHFAEAPADIAGRDWEFFRFYEGLANGGYCEARYARCRITGAVRDATLAEYCNIFGGNG
jgi:hypothetical protein